MPIALFRIVCVGGGVESTGEAEDKFMTVSDYDGFYFFLFCFIFQSLFFSSFVIGNHFCQNYPPA